MDFKNLLKDLTIGKKQEVGAMAIYPLIGEDVDCKLASFEDVEFEGTSSYGEMVFNNKSIYPFILPTGYTILTKQEAQDHATTFVNVLPYGKKIIKNACCVQQTQCGYIDGFKLKEEFKILPLKIRKDHLKKCKEFSTKMEFSRLWSLIIEFQKGSTKAYIGNLIEFFDKFSKDLEVFNAEFESVKGQRGAIITFNNSIVGIEVSPTEKYWKTIWKALIRDSYGSEIIRLAKENIDDVLRNKSKDYISLLECTSFEDLLKEIKTIEKNDLEIIEEKLNEILNKEMIDIEKENNSFVKANSVEGLSYKIFKDSLNNIGGELVSIDDEILYLSMINIR